MRAEISSRRLDSENPSSGKRSVVLSDNPDFWASSNELTIDAMYDENFTKEGQIEVVVRKFHLSLGPAEIHKLISVSVAAGLISNPGEIEVENAIRTIDGVKASLAGTLDRIRNGLNS